MIEAVADPDLKLRGGRDGFVLLALLAFLTSVISSFFTQNREREREQGPPVLDPPLGSCRQALLKCSKSSQVDSLKGFWERSLRSGIVIHNSNENYSQCPKALLQPP